MAITINGTNTTSNPGITGADTDTGLSFGTNEVSINTDGTERFRVGSAGQLGIGGATYGTSGQVLTSAGASAAPQWVTPAAGLFDAYAVIVDQKPQGTDGGTFTSGGWRTRDLNTELVDPDGIVTISSNQFTLAAGSYLIRWWCPVHATERHITRLQDITNATTIGYGTNSFSGSAGYAASVSSGSLRVVPSASTSYEIQHRSTGTVGTNGFGMNVGVSVEQYTLVEIFKEA